MAKGWHNEPMRHSLARRGIKTGRTPRTTRLPREVTRFNELNDIWLKKNRKTTKGLQEFIIEARKENFSHREIRDFIIVKWTPKGNPVEIKGQQLRIRILKPKDMARYRVHDVGRRGRLQLTLMDGKVQSYVLNLDDYPTRDHVLYEIGRLRLTPTQKAEAVALVDEYWKRKK